MEFSRELNTTGQMRVGSPRASAVVYTMKIRLCESGATESHSDNTPWDIAVPLDLAMYVKCTGGQAYVGVLASGLRFKSFDPLKSSEYGDLQESPDSTCNFQIFSLAFKGKGVLTTYPVASPFTSTRFPDTFLRLETELSQFRSWMNLKLKINVPTRFKTVFDAESLGNYERMFTYIMKVIFYEVCIGIVHCHH